MLVLSQHLLQFSSLLSKFLHFVKLKHVLSHLTTNIVLSKTKYVGEKENISIITRESNFRSIVAIMRDN